MEIKVLSKEPVRISVVGSNGELVLNGDQLVKILARGQALGYLDNE